MTNWASFATSAGSRSTIWTYDQYRGWLTSKTYAGGASGPAYTYSAAGRAQTRLWARGVTTTYGLDGLGRVWTVNYSDGATPNVTNNFDRLGRTASTVCNGMTDTMAFNDANELLSETFSGGTLNGLAVTNAYDALLRRTAVGLNTQPSTLVQYGFDTAAGFRA